MWQLLRVGSFKTINRVCINYIVAQFVSFVHHLIRCPVLADFLHKYEIFQSIPVAACSYIGFYQKLYLKRIYQTVLTNFATSNKPRSLRLSRECKLAFFSFSVLGLIRSILLLITRGGIVSFI